MDERWWRSVPTEVADEVVGRRFILACDRGRLRPVGCEVVLGRVGCSDPLDDASGRSRGSWYEVRDGQGRPLWRRIVTSAATARRGWPPPARPGAIGRGGGAPPTFDVVVPTVPGGVVLAIVGPPPGSPTCPPVDLAVLALDRL